MEDWSGIKFTILVTAMLFAPYFARETGSRWFFLTFVYEFLVIFIFVLRYDDYDPLCSKALGIEYDEISNKVFFTNIIILALLVLFCVKFR